VRRFLAADPALVNYIGEWGNTPLHTAVDNGRLEVARALIAAGANVNSPGRREDGHMPLFNAVDRRRPEIARLLLASGAAVDARDKADNTPLAYAADNRPEMAEVLLAAGADVNARRKSDGWTPLFTAVHHNAVDTVRVLLRHGADMEARSADGNTAMHIGANFGCMQAIIVLLNNGQNIDTPNADGNTPLMVAAWYGQMDVGRFLISAGADINIRNHEGRNASDEALRNHQTAFADLVRNYQLALDARAALDRAAAATRATVRAGYLNWATPAPQTRRVYFNDFSSEQVGPEWSTFPEHGAAQGELHVSITPQGAHRFLGELGSQTARLTLKDLPPHREVSLYFDLYILRTWDGNNLNFGPDVWSLSIPEGPTLLQTTFANTTSVPDTNVPLQAYPGSYPGDHNRCGDGAVETNSLGYQVDIGGPRPMDAVYRLSYTVAHSGPTLSLDFKATGLEALDNESWGLTNVQVSVASPAPVVVHAAAPARHILHTVARSVFPVRRAQSAVARAIKGQTDRKHQPGRKRPLTPAPAKRIHAKEKPPGL
jgi:ankyrin repeat protein